MQTTDTDKLLTQSIPSVAIAAGNRAAVQSRSVAREGLKYAFVVWLAVRLGLSAWGAFIMAVAPEASHAQLYRDYPGLVLPRHDLYGYTVGLWNIYDTRHYIDIAQHGYQGDLSWMTAYFPGYPLVIKMVTPLVSGNSLLAALLITNVATLIYFWYLYRLVEMDFGYKVARRAVFFSAIFPSSFFFFLGYTGSLVLASMVASIYYARHGKWWLAGLLAAAAALLSQPGVFILLPLGFIYWQQYRANRARRSLSKKVEWVWLLLAPLVALAYLLYRYLYLAAPISGITDLGGTEKLTFPGYPLIKAVQAIGIDNSTFLPFNLMDIAFILLSIALVVGVAIKVRRTPYTLFAIALGLANLSVYMYPYVFRPEVNAPRRLQLIFPIFILLALITKSPRTYRILAYISVALFLVMSGLFANWIFIS